MAKLTCLFVVAQLNAVEEKHRLERLRLQRAHADVRARVTQREFEYLLHQFQVLQYIFFC